MKKLLLLPALLLNACATVKTIDPVNNQVEIDHRGKRSYCKEIPRIYSGLAYNLCKMNGEPSRVENLGDSINGVPVFLLDAALSTVADTVVLPYTFYTQTSKGNIKVNPDRELFYPLRLPFEDTAE